MTEARATVLLVEDEPEIRRFVRSSLTAEGYRVVESPSGRRGAIDAGSHRPDIASLTSACPTSTGRR